MLDKAGKTEDPLDFESEWRHTPIRSIFAFGEAILSMSIIETNSSLVIGIFTCE